MPSENFQIISAATTLNIETYKPVHLQHEHKCLKFGGIFSN